MKLNIDKILREANNRQQEGKLEEAENLYQIILKNLPEHLVANYNLGVLLSTVGRLNEAESIYRKVIELKPDYAEAYSNLAIILYRTDKKEEAEINYKKAIEIKPDFVEAYNNLGIVLYEIGRLEEAEVNFRKAIDVKSDFAEAHNNLANMLKELNKTDEAVESYKKAIEAKPDYAQAYMNLSIIQLKFNKFDDVEKNYKKVIKLDPNNGSAYYNLANMLQELGRLDEAVESYRLSLTLKSKFTDILLRLSRCLTFLYKAEEAIEHLENLLKEDKIDREFYIRLPLALLKFSTGDITGSRELFLTYYKSLKEKNDFVNNNGKNFWVWLKFLLDWHSHEIKKKNLSLSKNILYVIGDSHALASHHINIKKLDREFFCKSEWIWGCKQWHLGNSHRNKFKYKFEKIIHTLPPGSEILLSVGEIDCRYDEGIMKYIKKDPKKKKEMVINTTIKDYLNYISIKITPYAHRITIQGIPCPNIDRTEINKQQLAELVDLIKIFNDELKKYSILMGFGFIDLNQLTNNGKGFSNGKWHADDYHITPAGIQEAWLMYFFN